MSPPHNPTGNPVHGMFAQLNESGCIPIDLPDEHGGMWAMPQAARATHKPSRNLRSVSARWVGIAIAVLALLGCRNPVFAEREAAVTLEQKQTDIDEKTVAILQSHETRIEALEHASGIPLGKHPAVVRRVAGDSE